ncbi:MAG: hypothetical protein R2877_03400 [Bdellovibrionota bacterium]
MKTFEKYWFLSSFAILFVSGLLFLYFRDFAPRSEDAFSVISSPWQSWMLKLHVLIAPIFVFWTGWISITHTVNKLKRKAKRGKKTGLINLGLLFVAIMSGYVVQIITNELGLSITANIHLYVSSICFLFVLIHQAVSKKKTKAK